MLGIAVNEMQRSLSGPDLHWRRSGAYRSRDALFHYQIAHQMPWGPQMRVADPNTGWWSTRRVIPYSDQGRRFRVLRKVHHHGLGDVPNDFEAALDLQYTPVREGWFYGEPVQGFPEHHREGDPQVFVGQEALAMLGDSSNGNNGNNDPTLKRLVRIERVQTALQIVSTASIAVLASLAIAKAVHFARMRKVHAQ